MEQPQSPSNLTKEEINKRNKEKAEEHFEKYKTEIYPLSKELVESHEVFPFPGIRPESYAEIKICNEEFPDKDSYGYTTPIDLLIKRFESEGMKLLFTDSKNSNAIDVYILPAKSNNIDEDCLLPKNLKTNETMDERLKKLILMSIAYAEEASK